jgi:uncharacterized protein (UPF0332 family)
METVKIIELAEKHIGKGCMISSAELCLVDAKNLFSKGENEYASKRALKSLCYSVGVLPVSSKINNQTPKWVFTEANKMTNTEHKIKIALLAASIAISVTVIMFLLGL